MFRNALLNYFKRQAILNKETCHHWIDFEIYEELSEYGKKKYLDNLEVPFIGWEINNPIKFTIMCRANKKDDLCCGTCDCTKKYKKTIKDLKKIYKGHPLQ